MKREDIAIALSRSGVLPGDTLMIHCDSIVSAQMSSVDKDSRLNVLFEEIISYLGSEGTLIVPAFSYSFTKQEKFDVLNSESRIGLFSETFRLKYQTHRSKHPIFSVIAVGKNKDDFINSNISDCFGEGTCFDLLYKKDAKLMNLGCDLLLTFTHFVEQKYGVSYRYFKEFQGDIIDIDATYKATTRYFVGDLKINYSLNLENLKLKLLDSGALTVTPFGRFASYTVSASNYHNACMDMLIKDEYSLIQELYR